MPAPASEPYPFRTHRTVAGTDAGQEMRGLTPRAVELLTYLRERDTTPSYEEMKQAIGAGSKHTVFRLVCQLEERGAITLDRYANGHTKRHSIRVVDKRVNLGSVATADLIAELERRGSRSRMAA
jgi:SOS-response transcriptional repressor LexA